MLSPDALGNRRFSQALIDLAGHSMGTQEDDIKVRTAADTVANHYLMAPTLTACWHRELPRPWRVTLSVR
jgi:hypothetical protein